MRDAVDQPWDDDECPGPGPADDTGEPTVTLPAGASAGDGTDALEPRHREDVGFGDLEPEPDGLSCGPPGDGADDSDLSGPIEPGQAQHPLSRLVQESVRETISGFAEAGIEKGLELTAHCLCPAAGHLVTLAFAIKEITDDVAALASRDGPGELKVPLAHLALGIEVEAGLQLRDDDETGSPRLSVFVVPGDDGVFGGWTLERDTRHQATGPAQAPAEPDAPDGVAIFRADLSAVAAAGSSPPERAAILKETAARLPAGLQTLPTNVPESMIVVYDQHNDLGLWLARPPANAKARTWRLELGSDPQTGLLTARLSA